MITKNHKESIMMTPEWERVIELARRLKFGQFTIKIKNGQPCLVENLVQQIKIDNDDDYRVHVL